jgi:TonB family protein
LKDLYVRFYETHEANHPPHYALWIFSKNDEWFFEDINKDCFPKISNIKNDLQKHIIDDNSETILTVVESPPEFPGGDGERMQYLMNNTRYPQQARENGIQGTVYVTFVIETDGSITDIRILKGVGGGCDEEVIKLIKNMPRWKSGTQNGKPVRVQYNMPVKFRLGNSGN